ncbi:unnamed protein product [Camellia sinensis]
MRTKTTNTVTFLSFPPFLWFLFTIPSQYCFAANDTLTQSQQLSIGQTLISSGQFFELGFFRPTNSTNQYIGVWYKNISARRVLWVLNRENPVSDSASSLTISSDGNLRLLDGLGNSVWSTNVSVQTNRSIAVLTKKGNFILKDKVSGFTLWESFNYPCDTFLPGMSIGMNTETGEKRFFSSWKSEDDPFPGKFVGGLTPDLPPQALIWRESERYWRGGPWDGRRFIGIQNKFEGYANGFSLVADNQVGTVYVSFSNYNASIVTILVLTPAGSWNIMHWDKEVNSWYDTWVQPSGNLCDTYGFCGPFGFCDKNGSRACDCLKGFVPKSIEDWRKGNWTGGCVRQTQLLCQRNSSSLSSGSDENDGFLKVSRVKLPDHFQYLQNRNAPDSCQQWCLGNCSCVAYAYVSGIGCMVWAGDLIDVQQFSSSGEDLFLRLAGSELDEDKKKETLIISLTTVSGVILLGAVMYGSYRWKANQREKKGKKIKSFSLADTWNSSRENLQNQVKQQDTLEQPMFDFDELVAATNNFSVDNKLGEGGFGPVFRGKLHDEQEIAVKRLSRCSGQGIEEFKNEIVLISRLQHRNLVRLLGFCIEGEEMLIVYDYMSNKSLDTFLFDPKKRGLLDWPKRFNIIQGIARGLLYLHRDSCLKIIHRDLKTSNILLDKDMNPKISDFGLARTFLCTQESANTHRVVGTHGYMSPEYALGGIFSDKSDVFSFGVLLLEIICGIKNTSFHYNERYTSLLGYAWELWSEGRALDLMDQEVADSYSFTEVMRSIHVGLLCVQDHTTDRPTMSTVVLMLSSEIDAPSPKKPTFTFQSLLVSDLQSQNDNTHSKNEITVTRIEGR